MGISIQHNSQLGFAEVARNLMTDLVANGFTEVGGETDFSTINLAAFEPTTTVDSLAATQPWRLRIEVTDGTAGQIRFHAATPIQIPDDRSVTNTSSVAESGELKVGNEPLVKGSNYYFAGASVNAIPLASLLNVSDHGISFCMWAEGSQDFSWFVIQRPVDNATGTPLVTGHAPVFCLFSNDGGNGAAANTTGQTIKRFTVRESDINKPSVSVDATRHSPDYAAVFNPLQQISISEGNNYVLTFPNGFNTSRYVYREEMDMIAYTSADVISESSTVDLTVYGEGSPRTYKAMAANAPFNTGARVLFLTVGGGI